MTRFINLSPENSIGLDRAIYKNARQLKSDALLLSRVNKSYCSATSLLILSSEEIIKAILVFLHSKNYNVYKLQSAKKFFLDHRIRHHIAQMIEMGSGFLEAIEKWEQEKTKGKFFKNRSFMLNDVLKGLSFLAKASQPLFESKSRIEEIQHFNSLKNQGLYVDYMDGVKIPKENITELQFISTKKLVLRIFRFYKALRILHHPGLVMHMNRNRIVQYQEDLQFFINDALKDFSFKDL